MNKLTKMILINIMIYLLKNKSNTLTYEIIKYELHNISSVIYVF